MEEKCQLLNWKSRIPQAITYNYDNLHWRMYVSYPDGSIDHTFLGRSSGAGLYHVYRIASGRPFTTTCYNSFGRVVRSGVTRYDDSLLHTDVNYDSYGHAFKETLPFTCSIVASGNVSTSFTYNAYCRQIGINAPNAGNRTFTYYATCNLQQEIDADNRIKTMSYDTYGRITSKALPEFTNAYNYNSNGLLSSESSTNNTSRIFTYDTYGRLYKDRDNDPDSRWLEKMYTYLAGNVSTTQYEGLSTTMSEHKFRWYKRSANRHARKNFRKYGVDR